MGGRRVWFSVLAAVLLLGIAAYVIYGGGGPEHAGTVYGTPVPPEVVSARTERQSRTRQEGPKQILFGDLHVHTTFSADAFMRSLPLMGGDGAHPPADACDYARFCSGLDFFALTDHAESLTPRRWTESKEMVRQCNAVAGEGGDPDLVVFTGFEWTQVGVTPEDHWGHKNVIFRHTDDERLPARPIAATGISNALRTVQMPTQLMLTLPLVPIFDFENRERYLQFIDYRRETNALDLCPEGVDSRKLPEDCFEVAPTPQALFEKLGQWGTEAMVIPHGTTWGFYTPPGYAWDKQLDPAQDDPDRQRLFEIMSGHGNSEENASWRAYEVGEDGEPVCPEPTPEYEPCCWRAGEIIRSRCPDPESAECEKRVRKARRDYLAGGVSGHLAIPGTDAEEWGDCGQCRDCFIPSFNYRPGGSAQYVLAKGWFGEGGDAPEPRHATYGFIASSDNHSARPGTGYKEYGRRRMTEATGPISAEWKERIFGEDAAPAAVSERHDREELLSTRMPWELVELERQASFFLTGGLVAVHSEGRDRDAIWDSLDRREVYGTSGPRILLWFDLVDDEGGRHPMGSEVPVGTAPRFEVRAAGAFEQKPGCPDHSTSALDAARLEHLCGGECYNPSAARRRITRIEVVRIRPQQSPDEPLEPLIEDVWRSFACEGEGPSCVVQFEDPEFPEGGRDAVYYVRAIQEPSPAVNAGGLRCQQVNDAGACEEVRPCYGNYKTPFEDDCLAENEERAWSSPIFVRFDGSRAAEPEADGGVSETEEPSP